MTNIINKLFRREQAQGPSNVPSTPQGGPATGVPASTGETRVKSASWEAAVVNPSGDRSLLVPAWFRGVSLIMQTMGQMVAQYQAKNREGGNFVESRWGDSKRLNYLLQVRPNPLMTASVMQEQIEFRKIYYGNAYIYIERNDYDWPEALWLCTSGSYNPIDETYTITYNGRRGARMRMNAPARDVMHFRNIFLSSDQYHGMPTIRYAFKALSISATADERALQNIAKDGSLKAILQEEKAPTLGTRGRANRTQLDAMRQQFAQEWASDDVVLLDNIADVKIVSQTAKELQLLEQRSFQVSDLARILGVPRIMMMDGDGGSYKMPEHATQEFMLRTIQPLIRKHEDEMNSKLLGEEDFGKRQIHICEKALRRLDAKGQAEIDRLHLETGWSVNEIRRAYDLPSLSGGEKHYVSANLVQVEHEQTE